MPIIPYDHGAGRGKRIAGICIGVLTALMLVGVADDPDLAGILMVALFAAGAWLLHAAGAREAVVARNIAVAEMQLPVLQLANEDGRLTATEVATRLGWTLPTAAAVLESLEDGYRVCSAPSDDGVMVYEFRELIHDPDRPRMRDASQPPPLHAPESIPQPAPGRPR